MNSLIANLVPIERCKIVNQGGSQYIRLPKILRDENGTQAGDVVVFLRNSTSPDTVIRIEKATKPEIK